MKKDISNKTSSKGLNWIEVNKKEGKYEVKINTCPKISNVVALSINDCLMNSLKGLFWSFRIFIS